MKSVVKKTQRASIALALSAMSLSALASIASAQGISTQQNAAGLSIYSAAEPSFFSPARNAGCEAAPTERDCDSFTVTIRNEGGQPTGVVKPSEKQTCESGIWDAANPPTEFKYQWLRNVVANGKPTIVSNSQSYTPVNDAGFTLTCRVIASNAFGSTVAYSQPFRVAPPPKGGIGIELGVLSTLDRGGEFRSPGVFRANGAPSPAVVQVGDALDCNPGEWDSIGNSLDEALIFRYRWLVDGQPAVSELFTGGSSFKVPAEAAGKVIQCEVAVVMGSIAANASTVYAASRNRVVVEPPPAGGEAPLLGGGDSPGGQLTLANTPAISGVQLTVKDTLPAGVTAVGIVGSYFRYFLRESPAPEKTTLPCELATLTCTLKAPLAPGDGVAIKVFVTTQQSEGEIDPNLAEVFDGKETPALLRSSAQEPEGKVLAAPIGVEPPLFGVRAASLQTFGAAGQPDTQAGDRPGAVTSGIQFPTVAKGLPPGASEEAPYTPPESARLRDVRVTLPPGLVGNPLATLRCPESKLEEEACPSSAQVGAFRFTQNGTLRVGDQNLPIFNTLPSEGYPAEFGGIYLGRFIGLFANLVRAPASEGGYTVQVTVPGVPLISPITNTLTTFFGDPTARVSEKSGGPALLTNPSDCGTSPVAMIEADSWQEIGNYKTRKVPLLGPGQTIENCSLLTFGPSIELDPDTSQADTPAGISFELNVPQAPEAAPSLGTPPLKDAVVTLPKGFSPSPAQADGLGACRPEQIDIEGEAINGFDHDDGQPHPTPGNCPLASRIASAKVTTPLLPEPVEGAVYLGAPDCSPCTDADAQSGKLIPLYIEARDKRYGVVVKLAGTVKPDPSGQKGLTATFLNGPQFPFSKVELEFKGGPRAALSTPLTCGTHTTSSTFTPWSAPETPSATPSSAFSINSSPSGPCVSQEADAPHAPAFEAGVLNPIAGAYSPFVMRLNRGDGTQRLSGLNVDLPSGLTGKLAGVPECSDAALATAASKSGKAEQASPSCPASSQVGTVTVGAGAGPSPLHTNGKAYLTGPYKGAPLSLAVITPAVAGPFDLGTVVVRAALRVDSETAEISAHSDPFPTMLAGIPLNVRSIALKVDRSQFTLNPTSCEAMAISAEAISVPGEVAQLSNRFQVAGCAGLPFKPRLNLRLFGGTKRGAHPKLRAVLSARPGEANIAKVSVALPRSEFLDQSHIGTVCTRVQFAADQCPKASIYGRATATTPLLDEPLSGPIYLRSSSNKLPDLVFALKGRVDFDAVGRIDSVRGGIRNTFDFVPDVPLTRVVATFNGGRKGLLINSRNLCKSTNRATVKMDAQNGKVHDFRPALRNDCGKKRKRHRR
jgi:hypothetical protein